MDIKACIHVANKFHTRKRWVGRELPKKNFKLPIVDEELLASSLCTGIFMSTVSWQESVTLEFSKKLTESFFAGTSIPGSTGEVSSGASIFATEG